MKGESPSCLKLRYGYRVWCNSIDGSTLISDGVGGLDSDIATIIYDWL